MLFDSKKSRAKKNYAVVCRYYKNKHMGAEPRMFDERLMVHSVLPGPKGQSEKTSCIVKVHEQQQKIIVMACFPYSVPVENRGLMAIALCIINSKIMDGYFVLDLFGDGSITYMSSASYGSGVIEESLIRHLSFMMTSALMVFEDDLFALSNGDMEFKQFEEKHLIR